MPNLNPVDPSQTQPNTSGTETYISDEIGDSQDRIRLQLGDDQWLLAESWSVEEGVLRQPQTWSIRLGFDTFARDAYYRYPPHTLFNYTILGKVQANGRIDRRQIQQQPGAGGIELVVSGRDALAPVQDSHVAQQTSFKDQTYTAIVQRVLKECGLDPTRLKSSNAANRSARAGIPITETAPPDVVNDLEQSVPGTVGAIQGEIQAKVGQRWLEFIRRILDRAGLMLWAAANGDFILSAPNPNQKPTYTLFRELGGQVGGKSNIISCNLEDNATERHTNIIIYGRGGGRKHGRVKAKGFYYDQEMINWGYAGDPKAAGEAINRGDSIPYARTLRDTYVQTGAQAGYFARRHLAEERRNGWRLEYTIAGHSLPAFGQADNVRAVLVPDTVVWVHDQLLGIDGFYYLESLVRRRDPKTTTTIRLMRPEDIVFGDLDKPAAAAPPPQPIPDYNKFDFREYIAPSTATQVPGSTNTQGFKG